MKPSLCIIVPCFNEANRIKLEQFDSCSNEIQTIVFVNDGSTDKTDHVLASIVQKLLKSGINALVINHNQNKGKGEAVRTGMLDGLKHSNAHYFAVMDADNSVSVKEIIRLKEVADGLQAPIVQGSRVALSGKSITRSATRHYIGRVGATLISSILGLEIYDTQAGAKIFVRKYVAQLFGNPFVSRWLFDCEVFLRAQKQGISVFEEPLKQWHHVSESSSVNWKAYVLSGVDLLKIRLQK